MLTPLFRLALTINYYGFYFLPKSILSWNPYTGHVQKFIHSIKNLWWWYIILISVFLGAFCYPIAYVITKYSAVTGNPREKLVLIIFILTSSVSIVHWGMCLVFMISGQELAGGLNQLRRLHHSLIRRFTVKSILIYYPSPSRKYTWTPEEVFLNVIVFCVSIHGPVVVAGSTVYIQVDPIRYILRDLGVASIFPSTLRLFLRFSVILLGAYELCRTLSMTALIAVYILETYKFCITLLTKLDDPHSLIRQYTQLRVVHQQLIVGGRLLLSLFLTTGQIIMVQVSWFTVKGIHYFPFLIYLLFPLACLTIAAAMVIFCRGLVYIHETSRDLVGKKWSGYFKYRFQRLKRHQRNIVLKQMRAQMPVYFTFGSMFAIHKSTPMSYIELLMSNLTNVLLLVDI